MLFSIIVPVYNVDKYLERCLESISNQSYKEFEVILVDDGSDDESSQICDKYVNKDIRFHVIHKKNGGLVSARKAGISVANGKYIINVDGDDYIGNKHLEKIYNAIKEYNYPDIVGFGFTETYETQNKKVKSNVNNGFYQNESIKLLKNSVIYNSDVLGIKSGIDYSLWSKAIKKNILFSYQMAVPEEISRGEDVAVLAPLIQNCTSYVAIDNYEYHYVRYNYESIMNTFDVNAYKKLKILTEYLDKCLGNIQENSVNVYSMFQIWYLTIKAVKYFENYKQYNAFLHKEIDKILQKRIMLAKVKRPFKRQKIWIYILKYRMYWIPWLFMRGE